MVGRLSGCQCGQCLCSVRFGVFLHPPPVCVPLGRSHPPVCLLGLTRPWVLSATSPLAASSVFSWTAVVSLSWPVVWSLCCRWVRMPRVVWVCYHPLDSLVCYPLCPWGASLVQRASPVCVSTVVCSAFDAVRRTPLFSTVCVLCVSRGVLLSLVCGGITPLCDVRLLSRCCVSRALRVPAQVLLMCMWGALSSVGSPVCCVPIECSCSCSFGSRFSPKLRLFSA